MKLEADAPIAFPQEVVFTAYRDRLPELVPYLPNVRSITVESRNEAVGGDASRTDLVNVWHANAEIPKVLQGIVKPEALAWVDRASWNHASLSCDWNIETRVFTDNVRCSGKTTCRKDGDGTILEIRADLSVDLSALPGVPRIIGSKVAPAVERFVVGLIRPNLLSVAEGLERFLKSQQ